MLLFLLIIKNLIFADFLDGHFISSNPTKVCYYCCLCINDSLQPPHSTFTGKAERRRFWIAGTNIRRWCRVRRDTFSYLCSDKQTDRQTDDKQSDRPRDKQTDTRKGVRKGAEIVDISYDVAKMAVPLMTESLLTEYNCSSDFRPSHLRQSRTVDQDTFGRVENKKKLKNIIL